MVPQPTTTAFAHRSNNGLPRRFDYVVAGGGTAGCVLAARLSENANSSVLLVEAGMDTPPDAMPADILDPYPLSWVNPTYRWPLRGHALLAGDSHNAPLLHARVMGGGSSIMGMVMLRGLPRDYDQWAELGAKGWSWREVLPWFRRLEKDLDFDGPMHGQSGPTEIRRHTPASWPPIARAASLLAAQRELPFIADMNGDAQDGYGSVPIAGPPERRASSASAYLTTSVRARPNLEIIAQSTVQDLLWEGHRVTGVRIATPQGNREAAATETILAMGALLSPHFLLRQGIGDPKELAVLGVPVRQSLPGVGLNLQNHAAVTIAAHIKRRGRQMRPQRNLNNTMFRFSSHEPCCGPTDMAINFGSRMTWHAIAARIAHFGLILMAPRSRGRVTLRETCGPNSVPLIEYNLLGDARDERRLAGAIDFLADLIGMLQGKGLIGATVPVSRFGPAARFTRPTLLNRLATDVIATATDLAPALGEAMVASLGKVGLRWDDIVADAASRKEFIKTNITPLGHHAGTCRMGRADDPAAVVDIAGRVHGVPGLRVADASVMPTVPRANTNLPTLMIAEKMADAIQKSA